MFWDKWRYELFDRNTIINDIIDKYKEKLESEEDNKSNVYGNLIYLFFSICLILSFSRSMVNLTNYLYNKIGIQRMILKESVIVLVFIICALGMFLIIFKIMFSLSRNKYEITFFNYRYCESLKEGCKIFIRSFGKPFLKRCLIVLYLTILSIIFCFYFYKFIDEIFHPENTNISLFRYLWIFPIVGIGLLKWRDKIWGKLLMFFIIIIIFLEIYFIHNNEIINPILKLEFIKLKNILYISWGIGIIILEPLGRKYNNEIRYLIMELFSIIALVLFLSGTITFCCWFFLSKSEIIYPLNTLITFILVFLILHKMIINLKKYKDEKKEIYNNKIEILKTVLKENNIKETKYEEILKRSIDKSEKYYSLENKFSLIAKSLLLWGGISIVKDKIKKMDLKTILKNVKNNPTFINTVIDKYEFLIELLIYAIFFIIVLWVIWVIIFFIFEKIVEIKYISKKELFEFRDLLQDIIITENPSNINQNGNYTFN